LDTKNTKKNFIMYILHFVLHMKLHKIIAPTELH